MKCGKTDLCKIEKIKDRYQVTWNEHITGLNVYHEKLPILLDMIIKDAKSNEIGIVLTAGYVLWTNAMLLSTLNYDTICEYIQRVGSVRDQSEVLGAIFDNVEDVETFVDRLEKKYIWHQLKI